MAYSTGRRLKPFELGVVVSLTCAGNEKGGGRKKRGEKGGSTNTSKSSNPLIKKRASILREIGKPLEKYRRKRGRRKRGGGEESGVFPPYMFISTGACPREGRGGKKRERKGEKNRARRPCRYLNLPPRANQWAG